MNTPVTTRSTWPAIGPAIGVIAIDRNEGDRLERCLQSLRQQLPPDMPIIYVDSGSTDGSQARAKAMGIEVLSLDLSVPFTMARGRNTGAFWLLEHYPNLQYLQFIDGDCELLPGWLAQAIAAIETDPHKAIVCGRRRERFPDASPYNRLAEMEWNTPVGEAKACGGDALMRVAAFKAVQGYDPTMICGEEPEMCIRLRQLGWTIHRIDADMTLHDAAMLKFGQWWQRSIRGGWAVAEGATRYGKTSEQYMVREQQSGWVWGSLPLVSLLLLYPTQGWSALLLLAYPLLIARIFQRQVQAGYPVTHAGIYAYFCGLSKIPQLLGQLKYSLNRWQQQPAKLIEYKAASPTPVPAPSPDPSLAHSTPTPELGG